MATDYIERIDSGDYDINGATGKWTGTRRFQSSVANLATNLAAVRALSWTVNSLALTPMHVHTLPDDPQCPKTALITARYEFPEDPYHFVDGRGYLSSIVETHSARAKVGSSAATDYIEGEGSTDDTNGGIRWKVVTGSNIVPVRRSIARITTSYAKAAFSWATYVDPYFSTTAHILGRSKKNSDACANIFGAAAGELLMLGIEVPRIYLSPGNASIPVIYTMLFQKGGVEKDPLGVALTVARYYRGVQKKYVLHDTDTMASRQWMAKDGTALAGSDTAPTVTTNAQYRIAGVDKQVAAAVSRTLYETTAYSDLNSLIYWG